MNRHTPVFFGWLWVSVIACKLSLVAACGPLAAVTSLVVERGLEGTWASVVSVTAGDISAVSGIQALPV